MSTDIEKFIGITHHFSDGLYAKESFIPKGNFGVQHKHEYAHLSILAKGRVIVGVENTETEYTAPACIEIKAGLHHSVTAIEDSVWFCIHATDEKDPEKVDQLVIMKE